jgi:outer membrane protein
MSNRSRAVAQPQPHRPLLAIALMILALFLSLWPARAAAERRRGQNRGGKSPAQTAPVEPASTRSTKASLGDVIGVAVRQSPGLRRARLVRAAAVEDAKAAELEQEWLAQTEVGVRRQAVDRPNPDPVQLLEDLTVDGQIALAKRLPSGGSLSLTAALTRREQSFDVARLLFDPTMPGGGVSTEQSRQVAENSAARAGITLAQPLLRGLGTAGVDPVRRARAQRDSSLHAAQLAAEETLRDIVVAYWELAYATAAVGVAEKSFSLSKKQLEQMAEGRRAGMVATNSVNAVEYQLAVREEALLRARVELRIRSMELRRLVALDVEGEGELVVPTETFAIDQRAFDLEALLERSLERNPELSQLIADKKVSEIELGMARDLQKPQLDLSVEAALVGNGENFGNALGEVGSGNTYEVGARLTLSYELGGARSAAVRGAEKRRSAVTVTAAERAYRIRTEVMTSYDVVLAARQRVALSEKAIALAVQTLDAEQANYSVNRSTTYSVLDRQAEVMDSERTHARAIADYHQAVARLELLTGELLEHYGVDLILN